MAGFLLGRVRLLVGSARFASGDLLRLVAAFFMGWLVGRLLRRFLDWLAG